jgi:diguanylate cyclase (GGDEF)-like protein
VTVADDAKLIQAALTSSGDVVYSWDLVKDSISWVGNTSDMFGISTPDAVMSGDAFHERINPDDLKNRLKYLSKHFTTREPFDCEYRVRTEKGGFCWIHERAAAEFSEAGQPVRLNGVLRLITGRKQHEILLEQRANYDELTGLYNKSRLREAVDHALAYAERYSAAGGFLSVGIDKMSMINDAYGRQTADSVIVGVARRLEECLRATDLIGRIDGDSFGIVLGNADELGIAAAAEKILNMFRQNAVQTPVGPVQVTVTIGGAAFPGLIQTAHDLMASAESAMCDAKRLGRNCFAFFEMSEDQRVRQREYIKIGEQVSKAMQEERIVFAYQPVVIGNSGETAYYETLIRMIDEKGEIVSAGAFVPVAERLGLMRDLDRYTLEMAISDLLSDPEITLALNISSLTASDRGWLRALVSHVKGKPEVASRLMIEITETAALDDFEDSARFVAAVRDLGCKVALDDFGSGYTSFRHLKSLTVDVVKIDGSFVIDLGENPDNLLFIRTLLNLADGFGIQTVAECVQSEEDASLLKAEGVDFMQGFYYGRPEVGRPGSKMPKRHRALNGAAPHSAEAGAPVGAGC